MPRGYVTVLYGFDSDSAGDDKHKREQIHGDAEDTAQRYDFINHGESHDENMLAETMDASSIESDPMSAQRRGL